MLVLLWLPLCDAQGSSWPVVFSQIPVGEDEIGSRILLLSPDGEVSVLTGDFHDARQPDVSFDGQRMMFSGRRGSDEDWDIFEMGLGAGTVRRLTSGRGNCREPIYLASASVSAPLFDQRVPWITFTTAAEKDGPVSLHVMSLEPVPGRGVVEWRTTYNLGGDVGPTAMADGRVLYSSRLFDRQALMTITWAGDNVNPFYGTYGEPVAATEPVELVERRWVVFVEPDAAYDDGRGRLARVSLSRPMHSRETIIGDGLFRTPQPWPDGRIVAAHFSGGGSFALVVLDPETGEVDETLYDDPDWHDLDALAVVVREAPIARIPMLEFASVLDIPGFEGAGQLQCINVYDSDSEELRGLEPGTIRWARFIAGKPSRNLSDADGGSEWPPPGVETVVLGEAPVEEDGSFFVNVPGDTPFYIELLDEQRHVVSTMRAWTWVRSGSQRGCIGCHADPELAPPNRATEALRRLQPVSLGAVVPAVETVASHDVSGDSSGAAGSGGGQ